METNNKNIDSYIESLDQINLQKWYILIHIKIGEFSLQTTALLDSGADLNCIREGLIPSKYFEKTNEKLRTASGSKMEVQYKISNASICNDGYCFKNPFVLVKNLSQGIILGTPFITQLYPFQVDNKGVHTQVIGRNISFPFISPIEQNFVTLLQDYSISKQINLIQNKRVFIKDLIKEIADLRIEEQLKHPSLQNKIISLQQLFEKQVCSDLPNAFWERKKHQVSLPYEKDFNETKIPTKARPIQMNQALMETCKKEIQTLLDKQLIRNSKSPWSCAAFYVMNAAEKERGVPRLVINYKPLNKVLQWIRYPIPNKRDLLNRLFEAKIFSKFDMKSGFLANTNFRKGSLQNRFYSTLWTL